MKRQRSSFLWYGTRDAAVRIVSRWCGVGPGSASMPAFDDRRFNSSSRVSWLMSRTQILPTRGLPSNALAKPTLPRVQWRGLGCKRGRISSAMWNDHRNRRRGLVLACGGALALRASAARAQEPASVIVGFDGSGSMAGTIEGLKASKVVLARDAVRRGLGRVGPQTRVGLVAFGHRRGDCGGV